MKQLSANNLLKFALFSSCAILFSCASSPRNTSSSASLICANAADYQDQVVGDGHCVSLIKQCTNAPQTTQWQAGKKVLGQALAPGSIIATFKNGKYPNKRGYHAAIYIEQTPQGIWVWDQWVGKPVHKRLIRYRKDKASASNTAQAYRVVRIN